MVLTHEKKNEIGKIDQDEDERCTAEVVCSGGEGIRLYDLPKFNGNAEQWPLFRASFEETTKTFKYTNRHNLMRLQKCLTDEAKDVVQSLLIYPSNVPTVMEEVEFRFDRPDLLIRSQLDKIEQFQRVTEKNVDSLIALSSLVRNVVAFLSSAKCEQHLNNPTLLEQQVYKLPPSQQFEWARHAVILKEYPTIKQFSVWLSEIAKIICLLPQPLSHSKTEKSKITMPANQNYTRRVMYAQNHEMEQENHLEVKCFECAGPYLIVTCEAFLSKNVQQHWVKMKQLRLCFSCLRKGHNVIQCRMKRSCGINGCHKNHNRLVHESQQVLPMSESVQQVLSCAKPCSGFLFKLVPIKIMGPKGQLKIFALVDEGSSITILDAKIASQLALKGKKQHLTMQWYDEEKVTQNSTVVNVNIKDEAGEQYEIKNVYVIANLKLLTQSFKKSNYEHLDCLPIEDYDYVRLLMLLGLNCANINASSASVTTGASNPVAIRTKLGWVTYGPTGSSITFHSPMLFARAETSFKCLDRTVAEYFNCENFGIENPTPPLESADDFRARKILSDTTRRINDRYEFGFLWRKNSPILPDSYAIAVKRLRGIEAKMRNNVEFAGRYKTEINKYIGEGYARKLTQDEIEDITKSLWYLPHFSVQNPHKPDKLRIVFDAAATVDNLSTQHC